MVAGDHHAYLEAGSISGVITSPGLSRDDIASPEKPMTVILRGGDQVEDVYGISAAKLILYSGAARAFMRTKRRTAMLVAIENRDTFEEEIWAMTKGMVPDDGGAS